jgi:PKD repeat protein
MYNKLKLQVLSKRQACRTLGIAVASMFLFSGALKAQLSGTYTVCASGCDYSSIQAAATALSSTGVKGAVTMEIKPGNYQETVILNPVGGVSATNTITFKGTGTKNTDVRIVSAGGTAFTISKADYITLDNIHFETQNYASNFYGVNIQGSKFINFQNCRATAAITTSYIGNHSAINIQGSADVTLKKNHFRGGSPACVGDNFSGGNTRLRIENNLMTKYLYYGAMANNCNEVNINYNTFDSTSNGPGQQGIYASGVSGSSLYKGNSFSSQYFMIYSYVSSGTLLIDSNYTGTNVYYGMQVDCGTSGTVNVTRNRIRCNSIGFYVFGSGTLNLRNNMIDMNGGSYGFYISPSSSNAHIDIAHNTLYFGGNNPIYQLNDIGAKDIKIRNNLITMTSNSTLYFNTHLYGNVIDDNNIYRTSGGFAASIAGKTYNSFADYKAALISYGTGLNEQNTPVTYVNAPTDLHLSSSNPAPYSYAIPGIVTDYDSDPRCAVLATVGADESKNTTGGNYAKITGTKFTGAAKSVMGYPTDYMNANAASHYKWAWYVDGVKVSDSSHLTAKALKYPSSTVKLVAANCSYKDSFTMTVTVDSPTTAPVSDFISDLNSINQNELVQFTDLSVNYPSSWKWSITPATGPNGATHSYLLSSENSQHPKIRFTEPGEYKVCLTATNAQGKGTVECKTAYVKVTPAVVLKKGTNVVSEPSGYIYDNGGPSGNTKGAYYWDKPFPGAAITGCFDSVYLVFKKFEMNPGYEFVRVYQGKDNTGKLLHPICNKPSTDYVGGLSGGPNFSGTYNCSPIRNGSSVGTFVYDTFKAAGSMYIEFESYSSGSYLGFEAYYWTKPRSAGKPTASFTSIDSICTATGINFTSTSKDATDASFLWDLDDDMSAFESTSNKSTSYAYFAPGTYKISLIVTNCGGSDTFTKNITVYNPTKPVTNFTVDNATPTLNDVVFLSTTMPMCVDEYTWTITPASGTGKAVYVNGSKNTSAAPQVSFTDTGCYDVQLVTKNVSGQDQLKLTCFIKVRGSYCVPTTKFKAADLGISQVKLNTLDNTSPQGQTPYTNYTLDPTKNTTIEIGVTYDLTVSRTTNLNKISRAAWIDWNMDGDFNDAGEALGTQSSSSSLSWTLPVKVPPFAKAGASLLRVAVNQGSQTNTPCGPNVFGEFEDYRVYVRPDATRPVITLTGADTVEIEQGQTYTDAGATAVDNLDGNVTGKIKTTTVPKFDNMTPATYIYKYNVADAAGNEAIEVRRIVIVGADKTAPLLIVPQPDTIHVEVFDATFTVPEPSLAEDLVDGDLTGEVKKSGNVNVNVVGQYEVTYTVADGSGNTATVKRVIIVEDRTAPGMTLVGKGTVNHEIGTPYNDSGVAISDNYYPEADLRKALITQNNVDINKLGTYTVVYTLTDPSGNGPVTATRTVIIVDTQKPTVTLVGDATYTMDVNTMFAEPGVIITDNFDNITSWDTSGTFFATFANGFADKLGSYTLIYTVADQSGNEATVTRTINVVDRIAPTVTMLGEPTINVCRWAVYTDPGLDISDNFNAKGDLKVTEEGSFTKHRTMFAGRYNLRFKVEDKSGNVTYSAWRSIDVLEPNEGECVTAIKDNDDAGKYVNVYPNPNNGSFTVKINMPKTEQVKITFTNLVGQQIGVVAEGMMSNNTTSVDFSNQPSGVYLLNIQTATQQIVKRVVVTK